VIEDKEERAKSLEEKNRKLEERQQKLNEQFQQKQFLKRSYSSIKQEKVNQSQDHFYENLQEKKLMLKYKD